MKLVLHDVECRRHVWFHLVYFAVVVLIEPNIAPWRRIVSFRKCPQSEITTSQFEFTRLGLALKIIVDFARLTEGQMHVLCTTRKIICRCSHNLRVCPGCNDRLIWASHRNHRMRFCLQMLIWIWEICVREHAYICIGKYSCLIYAH